MNVITPPPGYRMDAKGRMIPEAQIKAQDLLMDQTVNHILGYAKELNAQISRFKAHTYDDVFTFLGVLATEYKTQMGGQKGNVTLTSFDGLAKVVVQVADNLTFGPELQIAKALIDECVADWSQDARPELRTLIDHAFRTDQQGKVNREAIFNLRRIEIDDDRWKRAMDAITDSIRVIGSRSYVRFYSRPSIDAAWQAITVDLASAELPATQGQEG